MPPIPCPLQELEAIAAKPGNSERLREAAALPHRRALPESHARLRWGPVVGVEPQQVGGRVRRKQVEAAIVHVGEHLRTARREGFLVGTGDLDPPCFAVAGP